MIKHWGIIFAATLLFSSFSHSEWYMDITYSGVDGGIEGDGDIVGLFSSVNVDNSSSGWQLSGGYKVNQFTAFEVSYVDFGRQSASVEQSTNAYINPLTPIISYRLVSGVVTPCPCEPWTDPTGPTPPPGAWDNYNPTNPNTPPPTGFVFGGIFNTANFPAGSVPGSKIETRLKGIRLGMIGNLPINDMFSTTLQGGALIPDYRIATTSVRYNVEKETETEHDPALFVGIGLLARVSEKLSVKLFWEKYLEVGDADYTTQDLDTYNLALRLHF